MSLRADREKMAAPTHSSQACSPQRVGEHSSVVLSSPVFGTSYCSPRKLTQRERPLHSEAITASVLVRTDI